MIKQVRESENTAGRPQSSLRQRPQGVDTQAQAILVVDDSPDVQALARAFLEAAGYAVVTASDGEEGLRVYEQRKSSIGLLLTDVAMPKMSGLDLADCILRYDSQLPVLLMSGCGLHSDRSFEFIAKPFTAPELIGCVGKVLNASKVRSEREPGL